MERTTQPAGGVRAFGLLFGRTNVDANRVEGLLAWGFSLQEGG